MTTNEIAAVLNMVTDKLTAGANMALPFAEEVVRQYQARAYVWSAIALAFVIGGITMTRHGYRTQTSDDIAPMMIGALVTMISTVALSMQIGNAIAPLCGLLGK